MKYEREDFGRLQAMLDIIHAHPKYPGHLILQSIRSSSEVGEDSELRVQKLLSTHNLIEHIRRASKVEDQQQIDLVVFFQKETEHPGVFVQVKTSNRRAYLAEKRLSGQSRRIIVLAGGLYIPDQDIIENFNNQLLRLDGFI